MQSPRLAIGFNLKSSAIGTPMAPTETTAPEKRQMAIGAASSFVAGGLAGGLTRLCVAPLDAVKIRMQVRVTSYHNVAGNWVGLPPASAARRYPSDRLQCGVGDAAQLQEEVGQSRKYRGVVRSIRVISREEGVQALWRGNLAATLLWVTYAGLQFGTVSFLTARDFAVRPHSCHGLERVQAGVESYARVLPNLHTHPAALVPSRQAGYRITDLEPWRSASGGTECGGGGDDRDSRYIPSRPHAYSECRSGSLYSARTVSAAGAE